MKIKLEDIKNKAKDRPAGYYEDVVSRGVIIEDYLEISAEQIDALKTKYATINVSSNELPSLGKQAINFTGSLLKHALNGMEQVSDPIYEERFNICRACPFMNNTDIQNPKCNKCGCPLKKKLRWASESCPDDPKRWREVPTQKNGGCGSCGGR